MSIIASFFSFIACIACAGVCATVALSAFMLEGYDEDEQGSSGQFRWLGIIFATVPAIGFGSAAVHIILNF